MEEEITIGGGHFRLICVCLRPHFSGKHLGRSDQHSGTRLAAQNLHRRSAQLFERGSGKLFAGGLPDKQKAEEEDPCSVVFLFIIITTLH